VLGIAAFLAVESTRLIPEPTMPIRIFSNRTSLGGFVVAFVHSILTFWTTYFLYVPPSEYTYQPHTKFFVNYSALENDLPIMARRVANYGS
jgi:hypothetical protein